MQKLGRSSHKSLTSSFKCGKCSTEIQDSLEIMEITNLPGVRGIFSRKQNLRQGKRYRLAREECTGKSK